VSKSEYFNCKAIDRDEYGNRWGQELSAGQIERIQREIETLVAKRAMSEDVIVALGQGEAPRALVSRIQLALNLRDAGKRESGLEHVR